MDIITLTFGTKEYIEFGVSSVQNDYSKTLKLVMSENGPDSYLFYIFGADGCESVFPFFRAGGTSVMRFEFGDKLSPYVRIAKNDCISSFKHKDKVYGLEILNENRQKRFEKAGGHRIKSFAVEFGVDDGIDDCGIYFTARTETDGSRYRGYLETDSIQKRTETDSPAAAKWGRATVALNNTSTDQYKTAYFDIPNIMNKRIFNFKFIPNEKMMDNLYL